MKRKVSILFSIAFAVMFMAVVNVNAESIQTNNIVKAYTYDDTKCVTGDEATCVETTCYQNKTTGSCLAGTIIKYKVNDTTENSFHVLYDDDNTMTLYETKTKRSAAFFAAENPAEAYNKNGPTTALNTLESETNSWKNVNDIIYQMGVTKFFDNNYTECSDKKCTTNCYVWNASKTAKARMLTVQEAMHLGCGFDPIDKTNCPTYLSNNMTSGSLLMNGHSTVSAMFITRSRGINTAGYLEVTSTIEEHDIRAVVVVNKEEATTTDKNTGTSASAGTNTNANQQTVKVGNTLRNAYIGTCIGCVILVLGVMVIYQACRKSKKETENK